DMQLRTEMKKLGQYSTMSNALEEIEVVLNEPSESGLRSVLDAFWASLQELHANPESDAVRRTVRERAVTMADAINHMYRQLTDMQSDTDLSIRSKVEQINSLAEQISELNDEITRARASGDRANDLMDRRDVILDSLSKLIDIRVAENESGWVRVTVGGIPLVEVNGTAPIRVEQGASGFAELVWAGSGLEVAVTSGEIVGHMVVRDEILEQLKSDLNALAASIISEVNAQHALGFDYHGNPGGAFFKGTDAITIAIDDAIAADVALIAASSTGQVGDGSNALAMAQLKHKLTMRDDPTAPPSATWDDFIRGITARIGVDADHAIKMAENEEWLITEIENRRQSISGVSLDEEMTNMIRFQHAYEA
ncbi:MAG: flagellar hook-associated protein FlgK, partial [Firmicutes bacterium]|nr:flagellar hook-associated protein FlgK [Bacillota bacterium]